MTGLASPLLFLPLLLLGHFIEFISLMMPRVFFCFDFFKDRDSPDSPGWPETHYVDQSGLELKRDLLPSVDIKGLCYQVWPGALE